MVWEAVTREWMGKWKIVSPERYRFHKVIVPNREDCQVAVMYRLNLAASQRYELKPDDGKMNGACIKGATGLGLAGRQYHRSRLNSFYTAEEDSVATKAKADCIFYIEASVDEGYGTPFFHAFNLRLPLSEIHQAHGEDVGQREVLITLSQGIQASRLIAELTWGDNGAWTSWPPHQHEADLEGIYCHLDIGEPHFGLHLSYTALGNADNIIAHPVKSGSMVLAPRGYHPTVVSPGTRNAYLWVPAVHSHESRGYDLTVSDPSRE